MKPQSTSEQWLAQQQETALAKINARRLEQLQQVDEQALLWLALAPFWTVELATACGFPPPDDDATATLVKIRDLGLCEWSSGDTSPLAGILDLGKGGDSKDDRYFLTDQARPEITEPVKQDPERGLGYLQEELWSIGNRILQAQDAGKPVTAPLERWAMLAAMTPDIAAVAELMELGVRDSLRDGQPGIASGWIDAARPFNDLFTGELNLALARAGHRIQRHYRVADDRRALARFLERDEQIAAFEELVDGPNEQWALHYVGAGGVGKTMLVRHIALVLASRRGASIARIDFDNLNPQYPVRNPGLLLDQFAGDLRGYAETAAASELFAQFDRQLDFLNARLQLSPADRSAGSPLDWITNDTDFERLLNTFAEAAQNLPQPLILILDTCEELAKQRVHGQLANVAATFEILRRLAEQLPKMRVVFAGRRPLATAGAGWTSSVGPPNSYDFLRLHQIRGFTAAEATRYLLEKEKLGERAHGDDFIAPILEQSPETSYLDVFRVTAPTRYAVEDAQRYSPYDLALWGALVRENSTVTPEKITLVGASSSYIDLRIVSRIREAELRQLLPAVALVGRHDPFDKSILAALRADEIALSAAYLQLRDQEWIRGSGEMLEVDKPLRARLLAYYEERSSDALEAARRKIATHLEAMTTRSDGAATPLSELNWPHFDIAMRALRVEPERAARWWRDVERRFSRERAYDWALPVLEYLLGDEGAAGLQDAGLGVDRQPEHPLRPAVLATYAVALLHTRSGSDTTVLWHEVLLKAPPSDPLRLRAHAGRLATALEDDRSLDQEDLSAVRGTLGASGTSALDLRTLSALLGAMEALVERAERKAERLDQIDLAALLNLAKLLGQRVDLETTAAMQSSEGDSQPLSVLRDWAYLEIFAHSLAGRALALAQNYEPMLAQFDQALNLLAQLPGGSAPQLDWQAPDDLAARVRLEFARAAYPAALGIEKILPRLDSTAVAPESIDAERLAAAVLLMRAAVKLPPGDELRKLAERVGKRRLKEPQCNAHRALPPLNVTAMELLAASGEVGEALELLTNWSKRTDAAQAAGRARLRIIRRWRLRDERLGLVSTQSRSPELEDQAMILILDGLDGPKHERDARLPDMTNRAQYDYEQLHARWRTSYIQSTARLPLQLPDESRADPRSYIQLSCVLDKLEARLLQVPRSEDSRARDVLERDVIDAWSSFKAEQVVSTLERFVLELRAVALTPNRVLLNRISDDLSDLSRRIVEWRSEPLRAGHMADMARWLGLRRAAEIALEEGELLTLRLPQQAIVLLDAAREWFMEAGDGTGAIIAATAAALVPASQGQEEMIANRLALLRNIYQSLQLNGLPTWEQLEEIAEAPTNAALDALTPISWRPWLLRILACVARQRDMEGQSEERVRALGVWLTAHYGALVGGQIELPAEFSPWVKEVERKRVRASTNLLLYSLIGVAVAAGLLYWPVYQLLNATTGLNAIADGTQSWWIVLIVDLAVVLLGLGLVLSLQYLRNAGTRFSRITIEIRSNNQNSTRSILGETSSVQMTLRVDNLVFFRWKTAPIKDADLNITPLGPYDELAGNLVGEQFDLIRREIKRLHTRIGRDSAPINLLIDQGSQWLPWEAMLALALRIKPAVQQDQPIQFARSVSGALVGVQHLPQKERATSPQWPQVTKVLSISAKSDKLLVDGAWGVITSSPHFSYRSGQLQDLASSQNDVQVLHLIALPTDTGSGMRLQITDTSVPQRRSISKGLSGKELANLAPFSSNSEVFLDELPEETVDALTAEELVQKCPNLILCIVQAPLTQTSARTGSQREQAAYLRIFAAELFSAGVPNVITLPPLSATMAEPVLDALVTASCRRTNFMLQNRIYPLSLGVLSYLVPVPSVLIDAWRENLGSSIAARNAVRDAQAVIRAATESTATNEAALDICLYTTIVEVKAAAVEQAATKQQDVTSQ